jgi:hypothetical protein
MNLERSHKRSLGVGRTTFEEKVQNTLDTLAIKSIPHGIGLVLFGTLAAGICAVIAVLAAAILRYWP